MLFDEQFAKNLDMIESVMVALAAYVAIRVALGWRQDFVGRKGIDLAEQLLTRTHELKESIESLNYDLERFLNYLPRAKVGELVYSHQAACAVFINNFDRLESQIAEFNAFEAKVRLLLDQQAFIAFQSWYVVWAAGKHKLSEVHSNILVFSNIIQEADGFTDDSVESYLRSTSAIRTLLKAEQEKEDRLTRMLQRLEQLESAIVGSARIVPERMTFRFWMVLRYRRVRYYFREAKRILKTQWGPRV